MTVNDLNAEGVVECDVKSIRPGSALPVQGRAWRLFLTGQAGAGHHPARGPACGPFVTALSRSCRGLVTSLAVAGILV